MRNLVGSHKDIAIPQVEYGFFNKYSNFEINTNGEYNKALSLFLESGLAKRWGMDTSYIDKTGTSKKDLYISILDAYRRSIKPTAEYLGDKSAFNEFEFSQYVNWFGYGGIKFIHMVRNPYDCYASTKGIPHQKEWRSHYLYDFCDNWSKSILLGLTRQQQYPDCYKLVRYENITENPETIVNQITDWLGIDRDTDNMLRASSYERKSNSSFKDVDVKSLASDSSSVVYNNPGHRIKHLNDHEIRVIKSMCISNILPLLEYDLPLEKYQKMHPVTAICDQYFNKIGIKKGIIEYVKTLYSLSSIIIKMIYVRLAGKTIQRKK